MAVVQGSKITAADFNTLRGEVNRWYADNTPGASMGDSGQSYGWGGSAAAAATQQNKILATEMNALIDRCNIGEDISSSVSGQLSQVVQGNNILASEYNDSESKSDLITAGRLSIEAAEMSLATGGSSIRTANWGSFINCTFRYTFSSFDKARYFFNSGGAFNISGTITGYSTGAGWDGAGFNQIFSNMGTVYMNYTHTTQTGSGGFPSNTGFYDLPSTFTNIFSQTGTGAYSDASLVLAARYSPAGKYVNLRVTLTPGAGRSVNGTTTITTQRRKLNNQSSGAASLSITAPTYSLVNGL